MATARIVMSPVHDTTFAIVLIFAVELDRVSRLNAGNSGGKVDIMGDK